MKSRRVALAVFLLYAGITLFVTLQHEPWRDEADSWLILRDAGLRGVLERTDLCGTPALWYLLVAPLVALDLPYLSQSLLNLAVAWAAIGLFLVRAPLPWPLRILFAFSYYSAYEYAVIARPYALFMLLLFATAAMWERRDDHAIAIGICVGLLANATVHGLVTGAVLGCLFLADTVTRRSWSRPRLIGLGLMLAGGIASALQIFPSPEAAIQFGALHDYTVAFRAVTEAFLPGVDVRVAALPALVILALVAADLVRRRPLAVFYAVTFGSLFAIFMFAWMGGRRHAGLFLLLTVATMWMAGGTGPRRKAAVVALSLSLAWSCAFAVRAWLDETRSAFSGAEEMARFIRANDLQHAEIAGQNITSAQAVLPYLPGKQFYYPALGRHGSYLLFDREYARAIRAPYDEVIDAARQRLRGRPWLLLLNVELEPPLQNEFRLAYTNRRHVLVDGERYWLYVPAEWDAHFPARFDAGP